MNIKYPGSLHGHTDLDSNIRIKDSIITVDEAIDYAIELGHELVAFTGHEALCSHMAALDKYAKIKQENPNFKVILGNEIYLCRNGLNLSNYVAKQDKFWHFILLAKDKEGHKQLRELSTRAWMRSYKFRGMTRVPTYYQDLVEVVGANPGHLIGSTACLGSTIAHQLLLYHNSPSQEKWSEIQKWCKQMESLFGQGNFYLELQPPAEIDNEQDIVNHYLLQLARQLNIPFIITTDSHYARKSDAPIHKAYLNSQDGEREVDSFYATTYMMSDEELHNYFHHYDEDIMQLAFRNILDIKNKCEDYVLTRELKIPELVWKPYDKLVADLEVKEFYDKIPYLKTFMESDYWGDRYLAKAIVKAIKTKDDLNNEPAFMAFEDCLDKTWVSSRVNKVHWSAYFLNLENIVDTVWEAGSLVGPGRGSGVGFIILYALGITQINPLREKTQTFSWRFLNPDRVSVLDVDVDIESARRGKVLARLREVYGQDRVAGVITFGTEQAKVALIDAARGLGLPPEDGLYFSSLIPKDRGKVRTLHQCYYGDEKEDMKPVPLFVQEMDKNPLLWKTAQKIAGLVSRIGSHAGGVIFVDEPFVESTSLMKTPDGLVVTAYDLHTVERMSLIKYDVLSVRGFDILHTCLDLLIKDNLIEQKATLKETYENAIGIYKIERDNPEMWKMIWEHKVLNLFQMKEASGTRGIALIKPKSVDELATLNSAIRLMAPDKNAEQPLETWAKYRQNINIWYQEMRDYGLTEEEITWLANYPAITEGIAESQEALMLLVQEPRLGGNSLNFADKCRKALAKKIGALFDECEKTFYDNIKEKGCSEKLAHYVWDVLLRVQRGYSFNKSHTLGYSLVGLQEMNLAWKYPTIYWSCACLICDSGSLEEEETEEIVNIYEKEDDPDAEYIDLPDRSGKIKKKANKNYKKMASAIGEIRQAGVKLSLVDINESSLSFKPDAKNNRILFGLKGLARVGDDIITKIIENRPYVSVKDFYRRVKPTKPQMLSLIKGGAFDQMEERKRVMIWYIWEICDKKTNLTLQNMPTFIKYNMLPQGDEFTLALRVYNFNKYLKLHKDSKGFYLADERSLNFLAEIGKEEIVEDDCINPKVWDKIYQKYMDIFRNWIAADKQNLLFTLNGKIFKELWDSCAKGNYSTWEMEVMCFYYHEHELAHLNNNKYGYANFFALPEEPIIERTFQKGSSTIKLYKLSKICGTCIAKNKDKSTVVLLTTSGVVSVKFNKEFFAMYDKRISEKGADGKSHIVESSWFDKGSMIVVNGVRIDDTFICKKYSSTPGHRLMKITSIDENGNITLQGERYNGILED